MPKRPSANPGSMPASLGPHGAAFWKSVQAEFGIEDCAGMCLLEQCAKALDRAEQCRATIEKDGQVVVTSAGVQREHPLLKAEIANRSFLVRTIQRLGISLENVGQVGVHRER